LRINRAISPAGGGWGWKLFKIKTIKTEFMKRLYYTGVVLSMILLLSYCKGSNENINFEGGAGLQKMEMAPTPSAEMRNETADKVTEPAMENYGSPVSRKIIKDGSMEIRVNDLQEGKNTVDTLVMKFKAYYSNETFNNMDYAKGFTLNIRVPSASFDEFIAALESGTGEVVFKNISSRDVTEEFIDLETRLNNKKNYLTRYGDLLKQAKTVKDILEIQEKTRLIEEEVESVQGRLKYLNNQVDYSTLNLQINKKNDYSAYSPNKGNFFDRLKMSLVKGWFGFVSFILFLIRIWPFWLIVAVGYIVVRKYWRRRRPVNGKK
jgi:Domain of unknown function (DUF4349)